MRVATAVRYLLLVLWAALSLSSSAHADVSACYGYYTKTPTPLSAAPSKDVKNVMDHVIGHVQTSTTGKKNVTSIKVEHGLDTASRKNAGRGEELIQLLSAHKDPNSATTERVEEKSVKSEAAFKDFMDYLQSKEFGEKYGKGQANTWDLRDTPKPGRQFLTVTEYGRHFVLKMLSSRGKSSFVIKPRFRKYYDYDANHPADMSQYKSITGNIVAFELKLAGTDGPADGKFLEIPGIVFKPRILVTDEIAVRLQNLNGESADFAKQLDSIRQDILELKSKTGGELNPAAHVDSMMKAVHWLLAKDPLFLVPQYITAYNRSSYKMASKAGEYQLTADRNIRVYKADPTIKSDSLVKYIAQPSLFTSLVGEVFVELKSPENEKKLKSDLYTDLNSNLEKDHITSYNMGSGKYSIARKMEASLYGDEMVREYFKQGIQYWLIKGTSYMDSAPKEKDLLAEGIVQVSYPFKNEHGKTFRAVFEYRPLNNLNGTKDAILHKIEVVDELGNELEGKKLFKDMIRDVQQRSSADVFGVDFSGTIIPFVTRIETVELKKYQSFLRDFFESPERKLEELSMVSGARSLKWQHAKIRALNFKTWLAERTSRGLFGIAFATVGTYATMIAMNEKPMDISTEAQRPVVMQNRNQDGSYRAQLFDQFGQPVVLSPAFSDDGNMILLPSKEIKSAQNIVLYTKSGAKVEFDVKKNARGETYLVKQK